jgi:hypothetical protein
VSKSLSAATAAGSTTAFSTSIPAKARIASNAGLSAGTPRQQMEPGKGRAAGACDSDL